MSLNDISLNTEHFGGSFNQLADGRIYLVAGHNHNSVIRLDGLERMRRTGGKVGVSEEQARGGQGGQGVGDCQRRAEASADPSVNGWISDRRRAVRLVQNHACRTGRHRRASGQEYGWRMTPKPC